MICKYWIWKACVTDLLRKEFGMNATRANNRAYSRVDVPRAEHFIRVCKILLHQG